MLTTSEHRAAWDATFSAPKSPSLAALVGGDGRIRDAHRESINETVKELEKYVQARALKKGKD
jgi:conjugative relaxase-like TrwC/TraI family protein